MSRKEIVYWATTALLASEALYGAFTYLTAAPIAIERFAHVGYPQQLRVLLGVAKLAAAIVLLMPRQATLKEWAYAGLTFTWIAATVAHFVAGDGVISLIPVALLGVLAVSYVSRPADRRLATGSATKEIALDAPIAATGW